MCIRVFAIIAFCLVLGCGTPKGDSGAAAPAPAASASTPAPMTVPATGTTTLSVPVTKLVDNPDGLPNCSTSIVDELVYVQSLSEFEVCAAGNLEWTAVKIGTAGPAGPAGPSGVAGPTGPAGAADIAISSLWQYHQTSTTNSINIVAPGTADIGNIYVTDINLAVLSNQSGYVSVSGIISAPSDTTSLASGFVSEFSYTFVITAEAQTRAFKIGDYTSEQVTFNVGLNSTPPSFLAEVTATNIANPIEPFFILSEISSGT